MLKSIPVAGSVLRAVGRPSDEVTRNKSIDGVLLQSTPEGILKSILYQGLYFERWDDPRSHTLERSAARDGWKGVHHPFTLPPPLNGQPYTIISNDSDNNDDDDNNDNDNNNHDNDNDDDNSNSNDAE